MVVRKAPKPAEPPATVPRTPTIELRSSCSKMSARRSTRHTRDLTTPEVSKIAHSTPPHSPHHRLLVGNPSGQGPPLVDWSTCSFRVVAGGNPNEQAPQRLGAGLPDPDRASAMNAARRPAQHIAWHRDLCLQGPRQQEHPASVDRRAPWPRRDPRASETLSCSRICCPEVCRNSMHRHIRSPASKSIGPHRRHAQQ